MLRLIARLLLVLSLTLTSVTSAVAHMQAAGSQQIVLCGQPGEEKTVTLDAFGNPVTSGHHCPDCLAVTAGAPPADMAAERPQGRGLRQQITLTALPEFGQGVAPTARGPPDRT